MARYRIRQEMRYFRSTEVEAKSKAQALRMVNGEEPPTTRSVSTGPHRKFQLPVVEKI